MEQPGMNLHHLRAHRAGLISSLGFCEGSPAPCRLIGAGSNFLQAVQRFWETLPTETLGPASLGQEDVLQRVADGAGPSLEGTKTSAAPWTADACCGRRGGRERSLGAVS